MPRVIAGRTSLWRPSTQSPGRGLPITGKRCSRSAKTIRRKIPETKTGKDSPSNENRRVSTSIVRLRCRAAQMPAGMPTRQPITIAASVNTMVCGKASAISVQTARCVTMLVPRLPSKAWPRKSKYCAAIQRSRPSSARRAARASGVARSPRITMAGSPGTTRTSRKTSVNTASSVGIEASSLRMMKLVTGLSRGLVPLTSLELRGFGQDRAERQRRLQLVAEVEVGAMRPDLQGLGQRNGADGRDDLFLGLDPECNLLRGVGLGLGGVDFIVRRVAVAEIGDRRRFSDDARRVEELGQVDVCHRESCGRVIDNRAQILAALLVERGMIDDLDVEIDACLPQLRLHDLHAAQPLRQLGVDHLDRHAVRIPRLLEQRLGFGDVGVDETDIVRESEVACRNHALARPCGVSALPLDEFGPVDGVGDRLPHADVVKWLRCDVEIEIREFAGLEHVNDRIR